ncbi:beta-L-arabinofuranosidase domain-containing protein [Sphingomonas sp. Sphisp140]|uniref:beta-L-arabinofuranosidase domain-containing protein n=1 Tax=unclassified Sphingomonas TaxID=196159 RepID=UPI0039B007DF
MGSHHTNRRAFLGSTAAVAVAATGMPAAAGSAAPVIAASPPPNRAPLAPQPFYPLPTGAVRPGGWLRRQLQIQADGMGGRIDETWPDLGSDSGWLGGKGESWERGPYFLDGLVPLAWMLDSAALKAKAMKFIDWTLDNPAPNGMIGPRSNDDWWPRMVMLKVLTQYHELTQDPRVIPVMTRYFHHQLAEMPGRPLRDWGRSRWQDEVVSVIWLYNRTGDAKLLKLARLLKQQGTDWQGLFGPDYPYRTKTIKAEVGLDKTGEEGTANGLADHAQTLHGVNNAQALKASPVWAVMSGSAGDRRAIHNQLAILDRYHGLPIGIYSADEHLAGRSPSQGVELCAIVEAMYSLELGLAITGDAVLGDRIERIAYNALQATFTDDMWAHQYDQQPNQIRCAHEKGPWTTNGPEANLFGLEPNFGCCTANFHQGWPKLVASLWMATAEGGLAKTIYGPCEVTTIVGEVPVTLREETDYPFRDQVTIHVDPARPTRFPIALRVPGWARTASIRVNGKAVAGAVAGQFATIDREWKAGDRIELRFAAEARRVASPHGSFVEQGPLVFSLPIPEKWQKLRDRGLTADWAVLPEGEWRYALAEDAPIERVERAIGPVPFSRRSPPVVLVTQGYRLTAADWDERDNAAAPPPETAMVKGAPEKLVLMPYAAPKLRITSFPVAKKA